MDAPVLRRTGPGGWRMALDPAGQRAVTQWAILGRAPGMAWLRLRPRTGRTHRIRLHCAEVLGCPILGDALYGGGGPSLHLLARSLTLALTPPVSALATPPAHMRAALAPCGWRADYAPTL